MHNTYIIVASIGWAVFWLYWMLQNSNQKETRQKPNLKETLPYRILWTLSFVLLLVPNLFHQSFKIFANNSFFGILGDGLCVLGLIICIFARRELAGNWSMQLDLKKGHELITTGPYQFVRHPIYTGFLLLFLGLAITLGEIGGFIGFIALIIGCIIRIKNEEKLMIATFGKKYLEYKTHVKALIPYIL